MNKNVKSTRVYKLNSASTLKLISTSKLTCYEMGKIKGGEGEANSGGEIIIIPKPK